MLQLQSAAVALAGFAMLLRRDTPLVLYLSGPLIILFAFFTLGLMWFLTARARNSRFTSSILVSWSFCSASVRGSEPACFDWWGILTVSGSDGRRRPLDSCSRDITYCLL